MKCLKITVSGVVQGVGYRYFCYKKAMEYHITGYAKNLYNGNVEVTACGEDNLLKDFVKELNTGPRHSVVKSLKIEEAKTEIVYLEFSIY
jgi:acylphosphatase